MAVVIETGTIVHGKQKLFRGYCSRCWETTAFYKDPDEPVKVLDGHRCRFSEYRKNREKYNPEPIYKDDKENEKVK